MAARVIKMRGKTKKLPINPLDLEPKKDTEFCYGCYKFCSKGVLQCSKCKAAKYCSAECQGKDWVRHKPLCGSREEDIKSMRRQAFQPIVDYAVTVIENITKSGKMPGLFQIKSDLKASVMKTKYMTKEKVINHFYKGQFIPGAIKVELFRDVFQTFCVFFRVTANPGQTPAGNVPAGGFTWRVDFGEEDCINKQLNSCRFAYALYKNSTALTQFRSGELDFTENVANAFDVDEIRDYAAKAGKEGLSAADTVEMIGKISSNIGKIVPDLANAMPGSEKVKEEFASDLKRATETVSQKLSEGKDLEEVVSEVIKDVKNAGVDIDETLKKMADETEDEEEDNTTADSDIPVVSTVSNNTPAPAASESSSDAQAQKP